MATAKSATGVYESFLSHYLRRWKHYEKEALMCYTSDEDKNRLVSSLLFHEVHCLLTECMSLIRFYVPTTIWCAREVLKWYLCNIVLDVEEVKTLKTL